MQCPLCREQVEDENKLQVHYLMSCSGYVEEPQINKQNQVFRSNSAARVQFRWLKAKPTLAREVFLISSLAGSIGLKWNTVEECFLSEVTDVPKGLHVCQLVVDGDPMTTEDFEISDQSRVMNVTLSEASLAEGSTSGNISSNENEVHLPPTTVVSSHEIRRTRESPVERRRAASSERSSQKGTLYRELVQHQILHGDSLNPIGSNFEHGEGRRLGSGRRTRNSELTHITNDSNDFQQFLRPSLTSDDQQVDNEENNDDLDPLESEEIVERGVSSLVNSPHSSHSLSSLEDLATRPVLLGADARNDDQEVNSNSSHARTPRVLEDNQDSFVVGETSDAAADEPDEHSEPCVHLDDSDHDESVNGGDHENRLGDHEEVRGGHEFNERSVNHHHEEVPGRRQHRTLSDGHHQRGEVPDGEVPDGQNREEIPDSRHHNDVPDIDHHGEIPPVGHDEEISDDHRYHEQVPAGHEQVPESHEQVPADHEQVPESHHDEQVPDGHESEVPESHEDDDNHHNEVPDDHETNHGRIHHEVRPDDPDETLDRGPDPDVREQEPNPVTQRDSSIPKHQSNPFPVLDARNYEFVRDGTQLLFQQSEIHPTQDVVASSPARPSSAPTLFGREPEGGNEDTGGYSGYGVTPSAPPVSELPHWKSPDRTRALVSDIGRGRRLFDDKQVNTRIRRSPPGSVLGDQDIRRPPLYTSAPSRPLSSPQYLTSDRSVISPVVSPRYDERVVTSATRSGPTGGSVREYDRASRSEHNPSAPLSGVLNRQTPMGSARTVGSSSVVSSNYQPTTSEVWSDEKIKELLDTLKQPTKRKTGHSIESSRERHEGSEVAALRSRLAERDEHIKKLKARNTVYEKEIVKLRAKEMELAKALSLAETNRVAAKEQEDIVQQLTHALNKKEVECSESERKVIDMKRTQQLLEKEIESRKKVYELRVQELRCGNKSLSDELKLLRQDSHQFSAARMAKYKKLQEDILECRAVNNSLEDQVKLLETEKEELQKKQRKMAAQMEELKTDNTPSSYRKNYASTLGEVTRSAHDYNDRSSAVNGYLATSESTKFIARRQSNGEIKTDQEIPTNPGTYNYAWGSRNGQTQSALGYGSKVSGSERKEVRAVRHDGNTFSARAHLEPESSYSTSPSGWRQKATASEVTSSEDPHTVDVGRYLNTRSYSSDSITTSSLIQNGLAENYRNHDNGNTRERYGQDGGDDSRRNERRRKGRPHSYHSGSYENLAAPSSSVLRSLSTPHTTQFAVRGHHLDISPSSPDTSDVSTSTPSPRKGKPFAPSSPQELDQGMTVLVTRACGKIGKGKVKFIGYLPTRKDVVYLGLELEKEEGKHDGYFQEKRFFRCKKNHGIFVPFNKVVMAYT